jgi:hypothetical protein
VNLGRGFVSYGNFPEDNVVARSVLVLCDEAIPNYEEIASSGSTPSSQRHVN